MRTRRTKRGSIAPPERLAAFVLTAVALASSYWLQREAARVESVVTARRQQLEHLRTLSQPFLRPVAAPSSIVALRGLFADHELSWVETPAGPMLTVTDRARTDSTRTRVL
ncbi:MAG: hypothetical protein KDE27_14125 [Planctomycetes bacterium]|nr:hypothetical protein [Planctomycetota bacterium]